MLGIVWSIGAFQLAYPTLYEELDVIPKLCKVDFVCFAGEPNWLGIIILFIPIMIIITLLWVFILWAEKSHRAGNIYDIF